MINKANKITTNLTISKTSWTDCLCDELLRVYGDNAGKDLYQFYRNAFPTNYIENFQVKEGIADIFSLEKIVSGKKLKLNLYRPSSATKQEVRLKVFHPSSPMPLSDVLPMLEDMGLKVIDEVPYKIKSRKKGQGLIMIHDFGLLASTGSAINIEQIRSNFQEAFQKVWHIEMESDGFNALVLRAGLSWEQIIIIRSYAKYLKQAKAPFSQEYMEQALFENSTITSNLIKLFNTYFNPKRLGQRDREIKSLKKKIIKLLDMVVSADQDRILRRFLNVIEATLRTNYFQTTESGNAKPYLVLKLDSNKIEDLPLPRPLYEIFVYSPRFEAVHLRGGMVARGGLRWSDRPEDFRTEILGLMKAQMVKNTVIVPVGSKGGFVVKRPPLGGNREENLREGIDCYKMFMGGLLDITDNYKGNKVIAPKDVVRRDGDDPYLVVAADKGTATFSDIANGVAISRGFWLGDAFASGGSIGYDHKKMGITARGAWESVKRHFRELGKDIQNETFTTIGVGDMSGDVFGNGMLLSKKILLIAAFNHMHIFIDPDPDPATGFSERKRLFNRSRSNWTDYDSKLISKGGGVFERKAKTISLTPQICRRFGFTKTKVTPNELIQMLLTAETELLWFGGIGSYIKASTQSHSEADDRANDLVRVNANELRCSVIGEGANLGATQSGRIEFALNGGRINTDSVDNSAGVDCSDHEVNIKILVDSLASKGRITNVQRNKLLYKMTEEVGQLVLRDNYLQSQAISLTVDQAAGLLDRQTRFIREMERSGRLDREVEFLPDEETLQERKQANIGLTRPEISIVMAYSKLWLYDVILESDLPDGRELEKDLINYFPTDLRKRFQRDILEHRLSREIIASIITNNLINRVGGTFVANLNEKTGASPVEIAKAFIATRDAFNLEEIWTGIESLDNEVTTSIQVGMLKDVNQLLDRATLWFIRNSRQSFDIGANIKEFKDPIASLARRMESILPDGVTEKVNRRIERLTSTGVPKKLARNIACMFLLVSVLDIVRITKTCSMKLEAVARLYFLVGENFGLGWLRYNAEKLPTDNHWHKLASTAIIEELYKHQRAITACIINKGNGSLKDWEEKNALFVNKTNLMLKEIESIEQIDLSMLAVLSRHLGSIS